MDSQIKIDTLNILTGRSQNKACTLYHTQPNSNYCCIVKKEKKNILRGASVFICGLVHLNQPTVLIQYIIYCYKSIALWY